MQQYWLFRQFGGGSKKKWKTLEHNGPIFPPEYIPTKIPLLYENNEIILNEIAEEYAMYYAKYIDTEYINNSRFVKNFWNDWKKLIKDDTIKDFNKCDFSNFVKFILKTKEEKKQDKKNINQENINQEKEDKYKYAIVDDVKQPVGNYRIEPPGIFIGRGCHPNMGCIKKRVRPEDVIINASKAPNPPEGHKWKKVVHDRYSEWLCSYNDSITGKKKYIWLSSHSDQKGKNDQEKFDMARKLKKKIKLIREIILKDLDNKDKKIKQTATAMYFIENFALRVGNEKGEDEADTVGVSSLRVEHLELLDDFKIKLDFLGKDSVRYLNKVKVIEQVYNNIKEFMTDKDKHTDVFDLVKSTDINSYLQSLMPGLTGKVFRTFNASNLFYKELKKVTKKFDGYEESDKVNLLLDHYNKANASVAKLCNHQKNVNKNFSDSLDKINKQIKEIKKKINSSTNSDKTKKYKLKLEQLKVKKNLKIEMKNISLGTSKINYIDPRITIAFMKKHNIVLDKLFNKSLQEKFKWAFSVDADWKF